MRDLRLQQQQAARLQQLARSQVRLQARFQKRKWWRTQHSIFLHLKKFLKQLISAQTWQRVKVSPKRESSDGIITWMCVGQLLHQVVPLLFLQDGHSNRHSNVFCIVLYHLTHCFSPLCLL